MTLRVVQVDQKNRKTKTRNFSRKHKYCLLGLKNLLLLFNDKFVKTVPINPGYIAKRDAKKMHGTWLSAENS